MSTSTYIAALEQTVEQLRTENKALHEEVKELNELLEKALAKTQQLSLRRNSHNSSLPPSKDITRKTGSLREKTGKNPGGQQGHQGHTLKMWASPDETEKLLSDYCSNCGSDISSVDAVLKEKRQEIELPLIKPVCREYEQYERICPCCSHAQRPDFPSHLTNRIQYGEQVHSLAMYLNVRQYMPYKRLQEFFGHCCGLPISTGTLENMQVEMAGKGQEAYEALRQQIAEAKAVGADETGVKVNGRNQWAWTWQNSIITYIAISVGRGSSIIEELFSQGFQKAVIVSDRWKPQLATRAKGHQLCLAHLLRELHYLTQLYKASHWAAEFSGLLKETMILKNLQVSYLRTDKQAIEIEEKADKLLKEIIDKKAYPKLAAFQGSMLSYREFLLVFLYDPLVGYDNNGSERAIRNLKVKLKVSGQFKSFQQHYCVLRSIIDTAIKNKQPVLKVCRALFYQKITPAV